jgi:hypothetical protein
MPSADSAISSSAPAEKPSALGMPPRAPCCAPCDRVSKGAGPGAAINSTMVPRYINQLWNSIATSLARGPAGSGNAGSAAAGAGNGRQAGGMTASPCGKRAATGDRHSTGAGRGYCAFYDIKSAGK